MGGAMTAHTYNIIMISLHERIEHTVIAHNPVQAIRIGIGMMPACYAPCGITCKPRRLPIHKPQEHTPCAA